ncbi:MAG: hypothetical protein M1814_002129 [Vezdaea aestivalis]|nr:MAG: hypothetical protein M1814_002129 [Vezdaea aestivalis]
MSFSDKEPQALRPEPTSYRSNSRGRPESRVPISATDCLDPPISNTFPSAQKALGAKGWRALFAFTTRRQSLTLFLALAFSICSGVLVPVAAVLFGKLFNNFAKFGAGHLEPAVLLEKCERLAIATAFLGVAAWVANGCLVMCWIIFGEQTAKSAREKLFIGLSEREIEWFDSQTDGVTALLPRLQTQVRDLQIATSQPFGLLIQNATTALTALGVALYHSWNLTLVTLAFFPIVAVLLGFISARMQPSIHRQAECLSNASCNAGNAISAIETVKICNGQEHEFSQYTSNIVRATHNYLFQAHSNALQVGLVQLTTFSMFVQGKSTHSSYRVGFFHHSSDFKIGFWYGGTLLGDKNAGQIFTTFWSCLMATQAIQQILPQVLVLEKGKAAGASLAAVIGSVISRNRKRTDARTRPASCRGEVVFENVTFAYPSRPGRPALSNVDFHFPAGTTTFIVGPSGSGKSTLGSLLLRFYDINSGNITVDGIDLKSLDLVWLRQNITLVQQQTTLFDSSLLQNILLGASSSKSIFPSEIDAACKISGLQQVLKSLSSGLQTVVGYGGNSLSGGQRQRAALARAYLRDSPVLILDESTSALDHTSRTPVMEALREWRKDKTTIIITHDKAQVRNDYAYVMEAGMIVQHGMRQTLNEAGILSTFDSYPTSLETESIEGRALQEHIDNSSANFTDDSASVYSQDSTIIPKDVMGDKWDASYIESPTIPHYSTLTSPTVEYRDSTTMGISKLQSPFPLDSRPLKPPLETELVDLSIARHNRTSKAVSTLSLNNRERRRSAVNFLSSKKAEQKDKIGSVGKILKTLWPTLDRRHRILLVLGFVCATGHAVAIPMFAWVFARLLNTFFVPANRSKEALKWSLSVLAVAVSDCICSYFMRFLLEACGQKWVDLLRIEAFRRVLDQPRAWFDKDNNSYSKVVQCLDRNAEEMRNLVGRFIGLIYVATIMITLALVWSLAVCWKLTLVGLACAPFMYAVTRSFEWVTSKWEGHSNTEADSIGTIFTETFTNVRTVRALTLESRFRKNHSEAIRCGFRIGLKRSVYSGFFYGLAEASMLFVVALVFFYGALIASRREFTVAQVLLVFTMLLFSISNASMIVAYIPQISSSRVTATKLLRLASLPINSHEHTGRMRLTSCAPLVFDNAQFSYPSRRHHLVLRGLNLTVERGSLTAIIGTSGSGKSTLAAILTRMYPPLSPSSVRIAGRPISSIHVASLRTNVAVVQQTSFLFPATIFENIAYGLPEGSATAHQIGSAAKAAGIHEFISSLPEGYNTRVGDSKDGGQGFSGGQTQRIALARALARRPQVLILDEATSALDVDSAQIVRESILDLVDSDAGVTILAITHSRDMMEIADNIVVVDDGEVVEEGGFDELLSQGGWLTNLLCTDGPFIGGSTRPEAQDLKDRHILLDTKTAPSLQAAQVELERQLNTDALKKGLEHRSDRDELVERNILPDSTAAPGIQAQQRNLARHMRADSLEQKLKDRPKPDELVKGGILEADENPLKES